LLRWLSIHETDAHSHVGMNVGDLGVRFEDAAVAGDLDGDVGADGNQIGEIEIAATNAEVGDARFELGTGPSVNDPCFGGQRIARIAATFAASGDWRLLPTGVV